MKSCAGSTQRLLHMGNSQLPATASEQQRMSEKQGHLLHLTLCGRLWPNADIFTDSLPHLVVQAVADRSLQLATNLGFLVMAGLGVASPFLPRLFTTDPAVLGAINHTMPYVVSQRVGNGFS